MLKFIRGKGQQPSAERIKQQKDLFAFKKTVQHGFPSKPTALAWDPVLRLVALGTASGAIKVLGQPGVEFCGQHGNTEAAVTRLVFLPGQGRVVSLCDDNSLHLWEINSLKAGPNNEKVPTKSEMKEAKSLSLEGKLKRISAVCLESAGLHLLLGTEGGNVYLLDLITFQMTETIIYQDVVMQNVPEGYKINPGAVEVLAEQPGNPDALLIGYNRGLMVLWNRSVPGAEHTFVGTQQLESLSWHSSGTKFRSAHNDGSYTTWNVDPAGPPGAGLGGGVSGALSGGQSLEEHTTVYGPFPCRTITKLLWHTVKCGELLLFGGGLPRASYSDRHTVTAQSGERHVVFDFTSKVVDFLTIDEADEEPDLGPRALLVLAEEELVMLDLRHPDWLMLPLPYLVSLHASAVTCAQHFSPVPQALWKGLEDAGRKQAGDLYSSESWPVTGGECADEGGEQPPRELLLTGHEDGSVRFWSAGGVTLQPLYKFCSAPLFATDDLDGSAAAADEEDWPPFRKVGTFDPYSDDPRLAVKKVMLCPESGTLVVAGTAGHLIVATLKAEATKADVKGTTMNIVSDRDSFVWKGHDQLSLRKGPLEQPSGFQATSVVQLHPPAAITALALQASWGLVAAGTAHGLALYDTLRHTPVLTKCTLNPNDLSGTGEAPISRRKSFKKSLRESFRRLRKGRSQRHTDKRSAASSSSPADKRRDGLELREENEEELAEAELATSSPVSPTPASPPSQPPERRGSVGSGEAPLSPLEARPVERQVEARPVDDSLGSMVRCLCFARTFLVNQTLTTPTLWAGTNSGTVLVFTVTVPEGSKRMVEDVSCQLGKEIQLKHHAPVVAVEVVDAVGGPVLENASKSADQASLHRVVICSEEQFKTFTLPQLKPFCKLKLTAHEGARLRRAVAARLVSRCDENVSENVLLGLTNLGELHVLSLPELRKQLATPCIRREDINGISSLCFTRHGEALYLMSSSELQRVTLSARRVTHPHCWLRLAEGARPSSQPETAETSGGEEEGGGGEHGEGGQVPTLTLSAPEASPSAPPSVPPPSVNGEPEPEGACKDEEGREAAHNGHASAEERLELSLGDITLDSVKDHLASMEESRSVTTETRTVVERIKSESVVVKTSVVGGDGAIMQPHTLGRATVPCPEAATRGGALALGSTEINCVMKAPLATEEDLEESPPTPMASLIL